jgi:chromosome segregation ATPase
VLEEISTLRVEHDQQLHELSSHRQTESQADGEIERLHADVEALRSRLAEAESRAGSASSEADSRKRDDLKRRFELAVEDLRELKQRNAELEEALSAAKAGKPARDADAGGKLDWEAQKRRLLAELEADSDEDEEQQEERLAIEDTIRITDEIVARKDQEIAGLKRVLEEQSSNLGTVAVGAAAIAEAFDQDELIRQERANLANVQQEWRDKLKQAEIDISVERARVARERLELEEKLQWLEAEKQKIVPADGKTGGKGEAGSAAQRRWWARLGLKEADEK